MAIIGILAATAVVNFGKNEDRDVRQEKDRLTSFLREVQNKALAGDRTGITLGASEKLCGYGVHQRSDSAIDSYYIVTTNLNADCSTVSKNFDSNHSLGTFSLNNNVKFRESFSDIFFLSPYGRIYYNGSLATANINIGLVKGSSNVPPITISPSGGIK
jgi:type II secretory pathway pseudopilin PulG